MAVAKLYDLARMTVSGAPGTGTVTLGGAATVNGVTFLSFAQAGVQDGDIVTYAILDTANSEIGRGTYTAAGTTLARTKVLASTNGGAAINATASAQVVICAAKEDIPSPVAPPQGRLTLTSGTPVLTGTVSGATTVFFTPYQGNRCTVYDGTAWRSRILTELSQATTDATKSPAAVAANKVYDVFLWDDAGTLRATRGPAWSTSSSRGTGAGTSELQLVDGLWTNKNAVTNGPGANQGLYLGTIASNGSSAIDYIFGGAASGGAAGSLQVWNNFNRVTTATTVLDNGVPYVYTSATVRQARASAGNQVGFVIGLQEDAVAAYYNSFAETSGATLAQTAVGFGIDSTTSFTNAIASQQINTPVIVRTDETIFYMNTLPAGSHVISTNEAGDGANANAFNRNQGNYFSVTLRN